jgi:hypothetical protein
MSFSLWDWASSRKTGHIHLDLKPGEYIKYGRFVNELHATTAVLAEISELVHVRSLLLAGVIDSNARLTFQTMGTFMSLPAHQMSPIK